MAYTYYEQHVHADPEFPFYMHYNMVAENTHIEYLHWHESIEILNFLKGTGVVFCNGKRVEVTAGDTVIVDPQSLHTVCTTGQEGVMFHCLIADKTFSDSLRLPLSSMAFQADVRDPELDRLFAALATEMREKPAFYKQRVRAEASNVLIRICRYHRLPDGERAEQSGSMKEEMVKRVIEYLRHRFTEDVSIGELAEAVGFSRYYLCRTFKAVTGQTVGEYVQLLRCRYALELMVSTGCTVSEAADRAGFHTMSYFSKIYKRHMGHAPSEDLAGRTTCKNEHGL